MRKENNMLNGLNIQDSWKTITLVPDFMQEVISLSDFKDTLKKKNFLK